MIARFAWMVRKWSSTELSIAGAQIYVVDYGEGIPAGGEALATPTERTLGSFLRTRSGRPLESRVVRALPLARKRIALETVVKCQSRLLGIDIMNADQLGSFLAEIRDAASEEARPRSCRLSRRAPSNPSIHTEHVFDEELVGILPKGLEHQLPAMLQAQDLARLPLMLFDPTGRTRDIINGRPGPGRPADLVQQHGRLGKIRKSRLESRNVLEVGGVLVQLAGNSEKVRFVRGVRRQSDNACPVCELMKMLCKHVLVRIFHSIFLSVSRISCMLAAKTLHRPD
jgi:hypothetical protein